MGLLEKYRVWSIRDQEYLDPEYYEFCYISADGEVHIGMHEYDGMQDKLQHIPKKDLLIEHCIGHTDKNGKLVYEGDLLGDSEDSEPLFEVCWAPSIASFMLDEYPPEEASGNLHTVFEEAVNNMVIVDNVHERDKKREEEQD